MAKGKNKQPKKAVKVKDLPAKADPKGSYGSGSGAGKVDPQTFIIK